MQEKPETSVQSSEALLIQSHPHQAREIPWPGSCGNEMPPPRPTYTLLLFAYDWERLTWGPNWISVQPRQKVSPVV